MINRSRQCLVLLTLFTFGIFPKEIPSQKEANQFFEKANTLLFDKKDPEAAMKYYYLAIDKNPTFAKAHFNLGIARSQLKGFLVAISHFEDALRLKPDFYEVYLKTAEIKKKIKKEKEAIRDYTSYINSKPKDPLGYYLRADTFDYTGKKSAMEDLNTAIKLNPKYADAYLLRGKKQVYDHRENAMKDFKKVIELNPKSVEAYCSLAETNLLKEEKDQRSNEEKAKQSLQYLDKAIQINPEDLTAYSLKAYIYHIELHDIDSALLQYDQFLKIVPDQPDMVAGKAKLKKENKDYIGAKEDYFSISKKNQDIWFAIGELEVLQGNFLEAEKAFTEAIELQKKSNNPIQTEYFYSRARVKVQLKNYEGALEDYISCGDTEAVLYEKAIVKRNLKRYSEALDDLNKIKGNYSDHYYFYDRAIIKRYLNLHAEAMEDFNKAINRNPSNEYYLYDRGNTKYLLKDYVGAYEDYTKAIEINSGLGIFFQARAFAATELKDYISAREDMLRASDFLPDDKKIQTGLEELEKLIGSESLNKK